MQLSISNIAWEFTDDSYVYELMKKNDYTGLEIAPTRIFPENPYDKLSEAADWSSKLKDDYGFVVPSMQSIWFGRKENIFGSDEERRALLGYTRKAIDFAVAIGCRNLVFGCPRNRNMPDGADPEIAIAFFRDLGDYAASKGTCIGMEANPPIYNTNYMNDTISVLELIKEVDSTGFRLNLDVGTMIQNGESPNELAGNIELVNHVHISEPGLKTIEQRQLHQELMRLLKEEEYAGYISIEMGKVSELPIIEEKMQYIKSIFGSEQHKF